MEAVTSQQVLSNKRHSRAIQLLPEGLTCTPLHFWSEHRSPHLSWGAPRSPPSLCFPFSPLEWHGVAWGGMASGAKGVCVCVGGCSGALSQCSRGVGAVAHPCNTSFKPCMGISIINCHTENIMMTTQFSIYRRCPSSGLKPDKSLSVNQNLICFLSPRIGYDDQQSHLAAEAFSYSSAIKVQKAGSKILHHALS